MCIAHSKMGQLLLQIVHRSKDADQRNQHASECEQYLRLAMKLDPSDLWSRVYLANLYWSCGKLRNAYEEGKKLVELFPQSSLVFSTLGDFLASTDQGQLLSEKLLKRAIELDPEDADAHLFYGKALLNWHRYVEARRMLEKAHQLGNHSALPLLKSYIPQDEPNGESQCR